MFANSLVEYEYVWKGVFKLSYDMKRTIVWGFVTLFSAVLTHRTPQSCPTSFFVCHVENLDSLNPGRSCVLGSTSVLYLLKAISISMLCKRFPTFTEKLQNNRTNPLIFASSRGCIWTAVGKQWKTGNRCTLSCNYQQVHRFQLVETAWKQTRNQKRQKRYL